MPALLALLCQPPTPQAISDLFSKVGFGREDWTVDPGIPDNKEEAWGV